MKIAWVVDSSAGITEKEAKKRGWYFLPLILTIDGKEYKDGIDIDAKKYYDTIDISMDVRTSSTPPAMIEDLLKKLSKEYDEVVVYPLSKGLSSQVGTITMLSKEYKNVHVISSTSVGKAICYDIEIMEKMAKNNATIKEIVKAGNKMSKQEYGFALPETMDWLVKGGRASKKTASMAKALKIVPMIVFDHKGKLESYGKGRTFKKTLIKGVEKVHKEVGDDTAWIIYHGNNKNIDTHAKTIEKLMGQKIEVTWFPPIIANHIGPGVIALISHKKA